MGSQAVIGSQAVPPRSQAWGWDGGGLPLGRPASAGLCVSGAERRLPACRLADLTLRVHEQGRELTRAERRRSELFEEGRLKRTASTPWWVRVDDAATSTVRAPRCGGLASGLRVT